MIFNLLAKKLKSRVSVLLCLAAGTLAPASDWEDRPPTAVVFEGAYSAEGMTVVAGGLKRGTVYRGLAEAALQFDLEVCVGAPAGTLGRLSALAPHGGNFSGTRLGDLQGASNIAAFNHALLYELWLGGRMAAGRIEWRAGRLVADADFATTESGGVFLNSSFGWPAFISANTRNTGPAFNRSALGGYAVTPLAEGVRLRAGVYDGDSFDAADGDPARHPDGLHFELGHGQGTFAIGEISFETTAGAAATRRPGVLKLGAWRHTAGFADRFDPATYHSGNHGFYAVAEQMLWDDAGASAEAPRGLTIFARIGFSPGDRSSFSQTADAGLNYTGLLPGRGADTLGIGVAWARVSGEARRAERAAGATVISDCELVVEACYHIAAGARWHLVPDLQWVRHPGGSSVLKDAFVLGLRTRFTF